MKVLLSLVLLGSSIGRSRETLTEKFAWKALDFSWPSEEVKEAAIRDGSFIQDNNLPLAFDVWKDKIFVTVPRC